MSSNNGYKATTTQTAFGTQHEFTGPGLPQYASGVHLLQPLNEWAAKHASAGRADIEASTIVQMLNAAFEAGQADAKREIRAVLGVKGRDE
jgi:hypothetical protein